ncbi:hypothetical protein MNAN1_003973 [Malassezia nana]|uniref:Uncharacterized protein n=1 Tax=Malassezia nana TaxID=180528 RepID=A0AAF0J4F5_9BASI|nr:hypothetical protein MNAN1_003973 [Malassezia nana]
MPSWALVLLACPVVLVLVEYVFIPLLARIAMHGRLHIGSASLLRGSHDLVWHVGDSHMAVRRLALVWSAPLFSAPQADRRSRVHWLTLRIEGVDVVLAPSKSPALASAPASPPSPSAWRRAMTTAWDHAPLWLRRAIQASAQTLQLLAQSTGALALNFVALDLIEARIRTKPSLAELTIDRVQAHATVILAYVAQRRHGLATCSSDGFTDEAPTDPVPKRRAHSRRLVPEGRLRFSLDVDGVRLFDKHGTHEASPVVAVPHRTSLDVRAKFRERLTPQDMDVHVSLPSISLDMARLRSVLQDVQAARPSTPRPALDPPSRPEPSRFLACMRSAAFSLQHLEARHTLSGTEHAALHARCERVHVSLAPSDASEAAHQAWFGTCGVRPSALGARLREARRLWHARADCHSAEVVLYTASVPTGTLLASVARLSSWARTSATPYGTLAARPSRAPLFFTSDPNEAAVALRICVGHVRGAPDLASLVRVSEALQVRRAAAHTSEPPAPLLPRIAAVVQVDALDVVVRRGRATDAWTAASALVVSVPRVHLTLQGTYSERVRELRAAWTGVAPYDGAAETYPLQYTVEGRAGVEAMDVYVSVQDGAHTMLYELLHLGTPEMVLHLRAPASVDAVSWTPRLCMQKIRSQLAVSVQRIDVHLWQAPVLEALAAVLAALAPFSTTPSPASCPPASRAPLERAPPVRLLHIGIGRTCVILGSRDAQFEPDVRRGVGVLIGPIVLDYARVHQARPFSQLELASRDARTALRLPEHIDARARTVAAAGERGAALSLTISDLRVCPLVDVAAGHAGATESSTDEAFVTTDRWDFGAWSHVLRAPRRAPKLHQLERGTETLYMPQVNAMIDVHDGMQPVQIDAHTSGAVVLRVALLHTYCVLMAVHAVQTLLADLPSRRSAPPPSSSQSPSSLQSPSSSSSPSPPMLHLSALLPLVHIHIDLPHERRIFAHVHDVRVRVRNGMRVSLATLIACVPSSESPPSWDEAVVLRRLAVSQGEQSDAPRTIFVTGDCLHVRVPYGYYTHRLIEGSIVAFKASKQLFFQIVRGRTDSVIYPHDEAPKHVPPISVRFGTAALEAGDHEMDSALNLIFRAGQDEQLMRLERDRLFDARAQSSSTVPPGARARLDAVHSSNWIRRWHNAQHVREHRERSLLSYIHRRVYQERESADADLPVPVLPRPLVPPLVRLTMTHVCLDISQPTGFALADTHHWLHTQAGNPVDLPYTTLVPLHVRWRLSDILLRLRDYPIPLLHVPPRSDSAPSLDAEGDICVAEQLGDEYSVRHVQTTIVPALGERPEHGLLVPKSAMSPKLYGPVTVHVASERPTLFSWSQSIQPSIQDLQRVFDAITSPPHDPSPKPGPWDKLPLQLQGRLHIFFDSDVHLLMKGTRDPYDVLHAGAGWVLAWRKNVELRLGFDNVDREFLQVRSGEHVLAVPDLQHLVDPAATGLYDVERGQRVRARAVLVRTDEGPHIPLNKISWQLGGGVRWGMGLISEHTCTDATCERTPRCEGAPFYRQCRFFGRKPHWQVLTRSFEGYARLPREEQVDSFAGWRSDFVHLSVSLQAIGSGDADGAAHNGLYVTPRTWDHFRDWQRLFNGRLSLPIRQGKVFPARPGVKSPKFGRCLGTFKYRFTIAPLHVSHTFQQSLRYDLLEGLRTHVGLKARCSTFYLDMHQRLQETVHRPPAPGAEPTRTRRKPLYEAELDVSDVELYTVCARFSELHGRLPVDAGTQLRYDLLGDVFRHGHDAAYYAGLYDRLDFEELGGLPLGSAPPRLHMEKALTLVRINMHRLMEPPAAETRPARPDVPPPLETYSKFGHENSHTCLIGRSREMMDDHLALETQRLRQLNGDIHVLETMLKSSEAFEGVPRARHKARLARIQAACAAIEAHIVRLESHREAPPSSLDGQRYAYAQGADPDTEETSPLSHEWDTFPNQVWVDRPVAILTNETRDVLLRYVESVTHHGHWMQRLSVTEQHQLRDLLERARAHLEKEEREPASQDASALLHDLLADTTRLSSLTLENVFPEDFGAQSSKAYSSEDGIADEFATRPQLMCLCIEPELVLHTRAGPHSTLLFYAKQLRARSFTVCDMLYEERSIHHNVLYRHYMALQALQCFHSAKPIEAREEDTWVLDTLCLPSAVLRDECPSHIQQLMRPMHALVRFDRHNRLRLHDPMRPVLDSARTDDLLVNYLLHQMDMLQVLCPRLTLTATSEQYAALYYVATDLLLHSDPLQKEHERRRDSLAYSFTFDDPDFVVGLLASYQGRIHDLLNLQRTLEASYARLNTAGLTEYLRVSLQLLELYADMCMLEEAVFLSHASARDKSKHLALLVRGLADSIEWNMVGTESDPCDPSGMHTRFQLNGAAFARIALTSGSAIHGLTVRGVEARNVHPSAYFEEILTAYHPAEGHPMIDEGRFFHAHWLQLAPIGGVAIMDRCELHMHPFQAQLELKTGRQIMEYLFGTRRAQAREEDEVEVARKRRWLRHIVAISRRARNTLVQHDTSDSDSDSDASLSDSGSETSERTIESPIGAPLRWDVDDDDEVDTEALKNEMIHRASTYVSFVHLLVAAVTVRLSYKGDGAYSLTNLYDLEFQLPRLEYRHLLGTYSDLTDLLRRDLIRIAWNHRNTLIKGVMSTNARKHHVLKKTREQRLLMYSEESQTPEEVSSPTPTPTKSTASPPRRRLPPLPPDVVSTSPASDAVGTPPLPARPAPASPTLSAAPSHRVPLASRLHDAVEEAAATLRRPDSPSHPNALRRLGRFLRKKDT